MDIFRKRLGCLGWAILLLGLALIFGRYWEYTWRWMLVLFGFVFYYFALKGGDRGSLFPGTILVVSGAALIGHDYGWISFPVWRVWPIFFGSIGFGFLMVYIARHVGNWALIVGGLLLFITGAGFAIESWWSYQRWLRGVVDLWPVFLIIAGLVLVIGYWHSQADKQIGKGAE